MSDFNPIMTQEQLNEVIGERIRKAEEKAKVMAAEKYADYDTIKKLNEDLTKQNEEFTQQIQTLQEAAAETEKQLAESAKYRTDLEKTRIALSAGLKIEYADRLRGENAEEWKADAAVLAKDFAASHATAPLGSNEPNITNESSARDKFADWMKENIMGGN